MTLEEAQKQVDLWIKKYGVRYFSELTNMAVLTEEVGELARVMARKYGDHWADSRILLSVPSVYTMVRGFFFNVSIIFVNIRYLPKYIFV